MNSIKNKNKNSNKLKLVSPLSYGLLLNQKAL